MHASNNYSPSFNHRYEAEEQAEIVKKKISYLVIKRGNEPQIIDRRGTLFAK
jgi:hypothetical protein